MKRTFLITGATKGIGFATAERLAQVLSRAKRFMSMVGQALEE
jgi:NAD(P)-dependent dehydrogenase (short-subunit alcohol dehydrogenase family)